MKPISRLAGFDPQKLGRYETENYVAYYQKRWLHLLWVSIAMVKEAYQLPLLQAIYGAYLVARAEIAAAPFPNNDIRMAEAYIRRFFLFLKRIYALEFNPDDASHQEVNWWVVHRRIFADEQNEELVLALAQASAVFFGLPADRLFAAARKRAEGMLFSDRWVRSGMATGSPLLEREEQALCEGYRLLKTVLINNLDH